MGMHPNVHPGRRPRQTDHVGRACTVLFRYGADGEQPVKGTVLRDDAEAPGETIIMLVDGRVVRSAECQWSPAAKTSMAGELAKEILRVEMLRDRWRAVAVNRPEVASTADMMTASIVRAQAAARSGDVAAGLEAYVELKGYDDE